MIDKTQPNGPESRDNSDETGVTTYIPGMKHGQRKRNTLVTITYLILPFLIPFALAYMFGMNRAGIADKFDSVPGVSGGSGLTFGFIAFFAGIMLYGMMAAVLPWANVPEDTDDEDVGEDIETGDDVAEAEEGDTETNDEEADKDGTNEAKATDEDQTDEAGDDPPPEDEAKDVDTDANAVTETDTETEAERDTQTGPETDDTNSDETDNAATLDDFERTVENEGIEILEMREDDLGNLHVDYVTTAQTQEEHAEEMAVLLGAYAGLVDSGYESNGLWGQAVFAGEEPIGDWIADADDAQAYMDDEITAEEYLERTMQTIETYD